jgi:hypothetical protein
MHRGDRYILSQAVTNRDVLTYRFDSVCFCGDCIFKRERELSHLNNITAAIVVGQYLVRQWSDSAGRRSVIAAYVRSAEDTFHGPAQGTPSQTLSCCSSLLQHCIAHSRIDATLLNANLGDVACFDKADDAASRNLRRDMTDVFALAGGVATTIFERAK